MKTTVTLRARFVTACDECPQDVTHSLTAQPPDAMVRSYVCRHRIPYNLFSVQVASVDLTFGESPAPNPLEYQPGGAILGWTGFDQELHDWLTGKDDPRDT